MSIILAAALTPCRTPFPLPRIGHPSQQIALNVVVVPARKAASRDAILILQGGPGQAATPLASFYAGVFDDVRDSRDITTADAVADLEHVRHVIVKIGSHSFTGMKGCIDTLMRAFVLSAPQYE